MTKGISLSATEVSKTLGMDRKTLCTWIQTGKCPFGSYIKKDGAGKGSYYINGKHLDAYLSGGKCLECGYLCERLERVAKQIAANAWRLP